MRIAIDLIPLRSGACGPNRSRWAGRVAAGVVLLSVARVGVADSYIRLEVAAPGTGCG